MEERAWHPPPAATSSSPEACVAGRGTTIDVIDHATRPPPARRDRPVGAAVHAMGRHSRGWIHPARSRVPRCRPPQPPLDAWPPAGPGTAPGCGPRSCLGSPRGPRGTHAPVAWPPLRPRVEEGPRPWPPAIAPAVTWTVVSPVRRRPRRRSGPRTRGDRRDASACPHPGRQEWLVAPQAGRPVLRLLRVAIAGRSRPGARPRWPRDPPRRGRPRGSRLGPARPPTPATSSPRDAAHGEAPGPGDGARRASRAPPGRATDEGPADRGRCARPACPRPLGGSPLRGGGSPLGAPPRPGAAPGRPAAAHARPASTGPRAQPRGRLTCAGDAEAPPALAPCTPGGPAPGRPAVAWRATPRARTRGRPCQGTPPDPLIAPRAGGARLRQRGPTAPGGPAAWCQPRDPCPRRAPVAPPGPVPRRYKGDAQAARGGPRPPSPQCFAARARSQNARTRDGMMDGDARRWARLCRVSRPASVQSARTMPRPFPPNRAQRGSTPPHRGVVHDVVGRPGLRLPGPWDPVVVPRTAPHQRQLQLLGTSSGRLYR